MINKPLIGVVADRRSEYPGVYVPEAYMDALEAAGALAVVLPFSRDERDIARLATAFDGYLLTGGADVDPRHFGEATLTCCGELQPVRDAFELPVIPRILAAKKPVFAICRGAQALNVAMGGSLYQDIDAQHPRTLALQHRQQAGARNGTHALSIAPGSLLERTVGEREYWVNTFHHQAVSRVAQGFVATAWSADGVIECIEQQGARFVLGAQWHPELMAGHDQRADALFAAFVAACAERQP